MGLGNNYNYGNKRSNFNFQLNFLKQLTGCCGDTPDPGSTCPPLCSPPSGDIIGITDDLGPGDGWYLDEKLPILILIENGIQVDSVGCPSGRAGYYPPDNKSGPYIYNSTSELWEALEYYIPSWNFGIEITISGFIPSSWYCEVEVSFDGGTSWSIIGSQMSSATLASNPTIAISSTSFRSRLKIYENATCFYYSSVHIETE